LKCSVTNLLHYFQRRLKRFNYVTTSYRRRQLTKLRTSNCEIPVKKRVGDRAFQKKTSFCVFITYETVELEVIDQLREENTKMGEESPPSNKILERRKNN
jgi:N-acetylmuramoyl-L-alanine amidase CwlA